MSKEPIFNQKHFFKRCRELVKLSRQEDVINKIVKAINRGELDPFGIAQAGRFLSNLATQRNLSIAILGQCTTSFIESPIRAFALADDCYLKIEAESYDSVLQSASNLSNQVDLVILLPWHKRMLNSSSIGELAVADECNYWEQVWRQIKSNSKARIIQVGYDWCDVGAEGQFVSGQSDGDIYLIRKLNQRLRDKLPASGYFIDLEAVSGSIGRRSFYDSRSYYWAKQPFSNEGLAILAQHMWAGARTLIRGQKKVLILDLDNTLWGGVVGEVGPDGIEIGENPVGEAYLDFQHQIKKLSKSGVVLAVCSKNNESDAREAFEKNPNMPLQLNDFSAFKANWHAKSDNIKEISIELNLGLDSFVYFDDSAFEREQVRTALPEVSVANVSDDPSYYRQVLVDGLWFGSINITNEDVHRARRYEQEREREKIQVSYESIDQYLSSLNMIAKIEEINENNLDRVVQLFGKTNQFNLTTHRYGNKHIIDLLKQPKAIGIALSLEDKFGDYGLVSVLIAHKCLDSNDELFIDSWLMSCRTIARGVEFYLFNYLLEQAKLSSFSKIVGEYVPTNKNCLVKDLYKTLGFERLQKMSLESGHYRYCLNVESASSLPNHIRRNLK
jgi:FkbH-like protein